MEAATRITPPIAAVQASELARNLIVQTRVVQLKIVLVIATIWTAVHVSIASWDIVTSIQRWKIRFVLKRDLSTRSVRVASVSEQRKVVQLTVGTLAELARSARAKAQTLSA